MTQPTPVPSLTPEFMTFLTPFLKECQERGDAKISINMLPKIPGIGKEVLEQCKALGFRGFSCVGRGFKASHAAYNRNTGYCQSKANLKAMMGTEGLRLYPIESRESRIEKIVDRHIPVIDDAVELMMATDEPLVVHTAPIDVSPPECIEPTTNPLFQKYYPKEVFAPVAAEALVTNSGARAFKKQLADRIKKSGFGPTAFRISNYAPRVDLAYYADGASLKDLSLLKEYKWDNIEAVPNGVGGCGCLPRLGRLPASVVPQAGLPKLTAEMEKACDEYMDRLLVQLEVWKKNNVGGVEIDVPPPQTEELALKMRERLNLAGYDEIEIRHRYYVMDEGWKLKGEFYAGDWERDKLCVPDYGLRIVQDVLPTPVQLPPPVLVEQNDYLEEYQVNLDQLMGPLWFEGAKPDYKLLYRQIARQLCKQHHDERNFAVRFEGRRAYVYKFPYGITEMDKAALKQDGARIWGPSGVHEDYLDIQEFRVSRLCKAIMRIVDERIQACSKDLHIPFEYCRDEYADRRDKVFSVAGEKQLTGFAAKLVDALHQALTKKYGKELRWKMDSEFLRIKPAKD